MLFVSSLAHQQPLSKEEKKSSVSKLASYSQSLPGFVVRKCRNHCIKVLKVSRKHGIKFYKNGYKQYKISPREPRASKVPAATRFLSSPVCLPSCTAERRRPSGGEAGLPRCILGNRVFLCTCKLLSNMHNIHNFRNLACIYCVLSSKTSSVISL